MLGGSSILGKDYGVPHAFGERNSHSQTSYEQEGRDDGRV